MIIVCFTTGFTTTAQLRSGVDTTSIRIGEEISYSVEVTADTTDLVLFPEGQSFQPLEMIESYKVDTTYEQAKYRLIKKYGLTQFDSGSYTIPSQKIVINDKVFSTDSIRVEVADVPVDTTQQRMFEIKPAVEVGSPPFDLLKFLYWLLPLVLIGGIAWHLFRRKKKKDALEEELPPYEQALASLKQLDASDLLKTNRSKDYYSQLTEIVKRYLDREIDDTALESTSDELIQRLQLHKDAGNFEFDKETISKLDGILKRADLVKFAKMEMAVTQASSDRNTIEEIITETHEVVPEPSEEELLLNAAYLEELRKKKQRRKLIYSITGVFAALVAGMIIYGSMAGFDELKDKLLGNELRELAEKQWYKSEYGNPAIIIETPEILKRLERPLPEEAQQVVSKVAVFEFGSQFDPLYINISTNALASSEGEIDLEKILDASLVALEERGAKNMLVKRENFETGQGLKGLKAYGNFNVEISEGKVNKEDSTYELIIFAQAGQLQQVLVVYQDDGRFAEGIKERIINSIELEVQTAQQTQQ
jgi:hypothetical protein